MKTVTSTIALSTVLSAAMVAGMANAQTGVFDAQDAASNQVDAIEDQVSEDFQRETVTFGNNGMPLGWNGSVSGRLQASSGNTDTTDVGVGARLSHFDGTNGHRFALSFSYGEADGVKSEERLLGSYDYTREFGANTFFYGQAQTSIDSFDNFEEDYFVGAGIGYRVISERDRQWSVQAGPGYRHAKLSDGSEINEAAWSVSSNYFQRLTDGVWLFNETDVLGSEFDTFATNELGVNVALTDSLALQTSLLTEYHSDPAPGFENTDNTLAMSVVYNFN